MNLAMSSIGGKARALLELKDSGYRIPEFCVLDDSWQTRHLTRCGLAGPADAAWGQIIRAQPVDKRLRAWLVDNVPAADRYAVRSSAHVEDGDQDSFAGQFATRLNVSAEHLEAAILDVWASVFSPHALAYAGRRNLSAADLRMGIIIQRMLEPRVSGVAFAIDPVNGRRDRVVVSASYGLGEGLVSGLLDADRFEVDREDRVTETIACKATRFVAGPSSATVQEEVPVADRDRACISRADVVQLAAWARDLSTGREAWQDLEWCQAEGELWLLQSRPITGLERLPDPTAELAIWDNSNIIESYSGPTTPLTFSFVRHVYSRVYPLFFRFMGVEQSLIEHNAHLFEMVGLFQGRIYYNLLNWYRALSLLPGYAVNARFMEQMMGVEDPLNPDELPAPATTNRWWRLTKSMAGIARSWFSLPRNVTRFHRLVDATLTEFAGTRLEFADLHELARCYRALEDRLLNRWQTPLVNDFFAMVCFGVLRRLLTSWCPGLDGEFQNQLLCAERNIVSTEPIERLKELAELCLAIPELVSKAEDRNTTAFLSELRGHPDIYARFESLRTRFGARTSEELKLETITAVQDPSLLAGQLIAYVNADAAASFDALASSELRHAAEQQLDAALGPVRGFITRWVLGHTRRLVAQRENLRFERTRAFDAARNIFLAIGHRLSLDGALEKTRDIFWLTKGEIFGFIDGTAVDTDLRGTVNARLAAWADYAGSAPRDRFQTRGSPYVSNSYGSADCTIDAHTTPNLQGTGCCAGRVTGEAVVVDDPRAAIDLTGKILVAARTDPGWTALFPLASGILVERGSLLSHSAIVARELGIPAVVAVPGLLARVTSGDLISFDGSTGEISVSLSNETEEVQT
jgi:phosphohistidine swiveling domain-containing protein